MEQDGTNHFLESCSALADECTGIGLKCNAAQATCGTDTAVAWHSKVKPQTAKLEEASVAKAAPAEVDPKKYVLHEKFKATVKQMHSESHRVFAQGIIVTIMVLSVTVAMASSANPLISQNTWSIIDLVVATFLAVAWFIVVIHGLDFFLLTGLRKVALHAAVSVLFLFIYIGTNWMLRNNDTNRAIFDAIFTPMVMWCSAGFVETTQKYFKDGSALHMGLFLIVLAVWFIVLILFCHYVVKRFTKQGSGDNTENLMAGFALVGGFILWCHMMITGTYHSIEAPRKSPPSLPQVAILNAFSLFVLLFAVLMLPVLTRKSKQYQDATVGSSSYWKFRMCGIATQFVTFMPGFSFILSIGHLVLEHTGYPAGSITAQLILAVVNTAVGIFMIYLCAYVPFLSRGTEIATQLAGLLLGVAGLSIGLAWSSVLDNSISMMIKGSGYAHPFLVKLEITAFLSAFVFPVYCWYLKPLIMSKSQ